MDLVTTYTRRALTHPSDLLVALQGFVNELQKLSPLDGFVMGIWWPDADVQLAWVSDEGSQQRTSEGLVSLSWSWASRARSMSFPFNQHMGNQFDLCNGKRCCSGIRIELGKAVIIQSKIKQAYCFVGLFMIISTITASWESSPMRCTTNIGKREIVISITVCLYYPAFIPEGCRFSITNSQGNFVGWAALDPSEACLLPGISFS